jgi:hypothetical protein
MFLKVCSSYVPIFPGGGGSYRFQGWLSPTWPPRSYGPVLMVVEKDLLMNLDCDEIIDKVAESSELLQKSLTN